jgi:hypothetical protein
LLAGCGGFRKQTANQHGNWTRAIFFYTPYLKPHMETFAQTTAPRLAEGFAEALAQTMEKRKCKSPIGSIP